jgi:hypothetical protein
MSVETNALKALFLAALEKATPAERAAYLDEACAGDARLRQRVEALLEAHDRPDPLLDRPAAQRLAAEEGTTRLDFLEVLDVVGRGGMGVVLRAFDEKLHRVVAIKVLAPLPGGNGSARQRFVREARAAAAVTHDNVIGIYSVEDAGPVPYLVMQYIHGKTVQQMLDVKRVCEDSARPIREVNAVIPGWKEMHPLDTATGTQRLLLPDVDPSYLRALSFAPDGGRIATGGTGPPRLWDTTTGREIPTSVPLPEGLCPTYLPGGPELAGWNYRQGRILLCQLPSGQVRAAWPAHPEMIMGLAVSPDGRFLASFGSEGVVRVWSRADQAEAATLIGHQGAVFAAAFTPDGARLATGGKDDFRIHIWDLPPVCRVAR